MLESFVGVPLWLWSVLLVLLIAFGWWMIQRTARRRQVAEQEVMARRADRQHEGIQTHHQGGA